MQDTYARISGDCEQTDIHFPQITVNESLTYMSWLRLPPHIDDSTKAVSCHPTYRSTKLNSIFHKDRRD